jgi:hypothetical protein
MKAGHLRVDGDRRADECGTDVTARFDDLTDEFVPHDQRRRTTFTSRSDTVDVAAADAGRRDTNEDFIVGRRRRFDGGHDELVLRCI